MSGTPHVTAAGHSLLVVGLSGMAEVVAGDDLALLVVAACRAADLILEPTDVVCVSSKIVSKALGLTATDRDLAVAADTVGVVAARRSPRGITRVVRAVSGPVMAGAGVDESNTGPSGVLLRLPADPDGEARRLRAALGALTADPSGSPVGSVAHPPAVVITDTSGRPWRDGQTDFALGVAGLQPVDDARGLPDADGRRMDVTVRALADEVAATADLVKGKVSGIPVAVVRGLGRFVGVEDGPGAARLVRDPAEDWFGLGDVEAVHRALGLDPTEAEAVVGQQPPPARLPPQAEDGLGRAVLVGLSGRGRQLDARADAVRPLGGGRFGVRIHGATSDAARLIERIVTAAAAERLDVQVEGTDLRTGPG